MTRNRKKILRSVTVPNSIVFFEDIILKMKENGYEIVVVTSPGKDLDDFETRNPEFRTVRLPMERHISILKDFISLLRMIKIDDVSGMDDASPCACTHVYGFNLADFSGIQAKTSTFDG